MTRFKLVVEYDGTPFHGWQRQDGLATVQQVLEEAIEIFAGHPVRLHCAGRTDAGVHALHQVAHVDIQKDIRADRVRDACNAHLRPHPIAVVSAETVDAQFDARRSATGRAYLYRIVDRRPPPALELTRVWHVPWRLDEMRMNEAAQILVGHHDFTTFRAAECQASSPVKTLDRLDVERIGQEIRIHAASRSFLHHQVRSMVGALMQVGGGRWPVARMRTALEARDRKACPGMAPAHGLYLTDVRYGR